MFESESMYLKFSGPKACWSYKNKRECLPLGSHRAFRRLIDHIYWHPGIFYEILAIKIINDLQYDNHTVNRLDGKNSRFSNIVLLNPEYEVKFKLWYVGSNYDNFCKHQFILNDRIKKHKNFKPLYMGLSEFKCSFEKSDGNCLPNKNINADYLGLYDTYPNIIEKHFKEIGINKIKEWSVEDKDIIMPISIKSGVCEFPCRYSSYLSIMMSGE